MGKVEEWPLRAPSDRMGKILKCMVNFFGGLGNDAIVGSTNLTLSKHSELLYTTIIGRG
jgi:hypothetical protein